jgi:hypothetical protein
MLSTNQLKVDDGSGGLCYFHWLVMALSINQEKKKERKEKVKKKEMEDWFYGDGKAPLLILSFFLHLASLTFQIPRPSLGSNP